MISQKKSVKPAPGSEEIPLPMCRNFTLPSMDRKLLPAGLKAAVSAAQENSSNASPSLSQDSFQSARTADGRPRRGNSSREEGRGHSERIKTKVHKDTLQVGREEVDLRFVEQLIHTEQTAALAQMVRCCVAQGPVFPVYGPSDCRYSVGSDQQKRAAVH